LELIQETDKSFFLTGKAGTGKSTFLKHIVETTSKNFIVVAPTGIAAVNVGGVTIHSFFQFPLRPLLPEDEDIKIFWKDSEKRKIISKLDTLIIDEISMVRADLVDGIDYSLRRNGGNPNLPFGGIQVVFVGDIFQLEPVTIKKSGELKIINEIYGSSYFYNAKVFDKIKLFTVELRKVYRQTDEAFIELLDKVRIKEINQNEIDKINDRVFSEDELKAKEFAITLTTRNDLAEKVNSEKLLELNSEPFSFFAEVTGEFEESKYPTEPELILKEGAQIIFIKNDSEQRWVNGTIGQIHKLSDNEIEVKLDDDSIHIVEKREWENVKYQYNRDKKKIEQETVGTFIQYPLKLAWAITIHKSQGLTFENVVIDFGTGTFASGQAYVALSRATKYSGLFLKKKMHLSDIYIDDEIKEFSKSFNNKKAIDENLIVGKKIYNYKKNFDTERIGDYYFSEAINSFIAGDFKETFNQLMLGFEKVTCDCELSRLVKKHSEALKKSLKLSSINCSTQELDFIRAVYFFFSDEDSKALPQIESFLEDNDESEIGHYLKGRIYAGLENMEGAYFELEKALSLKETSRVLYRIGRYKEQKSEDFGINQLLQSVVLNLSSLCCNRWLKDSADKREIKLETNTNKLLANYFNNKTTDEYLTTLNGLLKNGNVELNNNSTLSSTKAFEDFLKTLNSDSHLFGISDTNISDDSDDEFYDNSDNFDYYDDYDDYGSSYEKYGGYNGYSDDVIDDAFEGDPMNTWNVD
ncbi:MAG: DEAD/DEAH box helicase, partial [Bacteroidales bacterium]|nr:DEAD/DEAH box helicase [Bacteroidales bacterium]